MSYDMLVSIYGDYRVEIVTIATTTFLLGMIIHHYHKHRHCLRGIERYFQWHDLMIALHGFMSNGGGIPILVFLIGLIIWLKGVSGSDMLFVAFVSAVVASGVIKAIYKGHKRYLILEYEDLYHNGKKIMKSHEGWEVFAVMLAVLLLF